MKNIKKIFALILAMIMILSMSMISYADEPTTYIEVPAASTHIYEAYQIFTGTLADSVLTSLTWGTGVTDAGKTHFGDASAKGATLSSAALATAFANELEQGAGGTSYLQNPISLTAGEKTEVDTGYYLIRDKSANVPAGHANTLYIMHIAGGITLQVKETYPESHKNQNTVQENYSKAPVDVSIGEKVYYEITGTIPSRIGDYATYKYIFHDKMSTGLTFNNDVKVYLNTKAAENEVTDKFTVVTTGLTDGCTFEVRCADIKAIPGVAADGQFIVEYSATLNENADIGNPGEKNTSKLEFSNNPNAGHEGETGSTPEETVYAFTFMLDVDKVDGATGYGLQNAEFKLKKSATEWAKVESGKFKAWVAEADATTLISNSNGKFAVKGLDAGTYYLKETKAPDTYEPLSDELKIEILPTYNADGTAISALNGKLTYGTGEPYNAPMDITTGAVVVKVENTKGHSLPSTGGVGTTLFYVFGAILVVIAGVLLITKKRMSAK